MDGTIPSSLFRVRVATLSLKLEGLSLSIKESSLTWHVGP